MTTKNKRINCVISDEYYDKIDKISKKTGLSKSAFLTICIMEYFKNHANELPVKGE